MVFSAEIEVWNNQAKKTFSDQASLSLWDACVQDVIALKPGNVHQYRDGHGMSVEQFLQSAWAICHEMPKAGYSLGTRIEKSAMATRDAVQVNTNIGIILLCAPLVHGFLEFSGNQNFRESVCQSIEKSTLPESEQILNAIRIANPAGLGNVEKHDVQEPAVLPIREIMSKAQYRDMIARQYSNNFEDIFKFGMNTLKQANEQFNEEASSTTYVYLNFMLHFEDSHIVRKFGNSKAKEIQLIANHLLELYKKAGGIDEIRSELMEVDRIWKQKNINPGTSADLTVATILASKLHNAVN